METRDQKLRWYFNILSDTKSLRNQAGYFCIATMNIFLSLGTVLVSLKMFYGHSHFEKKHEADNELVRATTPSFPILFEVGYLAHEG